MAVVAVKKKQIRKEVTCPTCKGLLSYGREDVEIGYLGCEFITCPECWTQIITTDERVVPPTFPQTFFHCGDGAKISDKDIQKMVNEAVDNIKTAKTGEFYTIATGDTNVIALKYEDDIDIIVAKDYWEDSLINED